MAIWPGWVSFIKQAADAVVGLVVQRSSSSATADLQQWQDEASTILLTVDKSAVINALVPSSSPAVYVDLKGYQNFQGDQIWRTSGQFRMVGGFQIEASTGGFWEFTLWNGTSTTPFQGYNWALGQYHFKSYTDRFEVAAIRPGALNAYNSLSDVKFAGRQTSAGIPTSNTWVANDMMIDSKGVVHLCTTGGTPGTWAAGGWQLAGFWKAGSALQTSGAITVAAFDELMIVARIVSLSASDVPAFRFNGDTGNNYSYNFLTAGSSTTATLTATATNTTSMAKLSGNSGTFTRVIKAVVNNRLGTSKTGLVMAANGSGAAATNSVRDVQAQFEWVNTTAQITSVTMLTAGGTATMAADSGFQVFGRDFA